jgi:hypothetical protein
VERTFGWLGRFRRLARDYERLTITLEGWHWLAFVARLLANVGPKSALQALAKGADAVVTEILTEVTPAEPESAFGSDRAPRAR